MKRFTRVAALCLEITFCAGAAAYAQPATPSGLPAESRVYLEINAGPTLGHKSDTFIGGEAGLQVRPNLDVFVELGRMGNVANSQMDADAATVATFIGGTADSTAIKATYFDIGVRYRLSMISIPRANPYLLAGVGLAHTTREAAWSVNGTPVDPATLGVQLGGDLTGSSNKTLIVAGGGFNVPITDRFYVDIGYRYGGILAKTDDVETDRSLKTQRIVFGAGYRF
jgi:opacity protein-like surface antigen